MIFHFCHLSQQTKYITFRQKNERKKQTKQPTAA